MSKQSGSVAVRSKEFIDRAVLFAEIYSKASSRKDTHVDTYLKNHSIFEALYFIQRDSSVRKDGSAEKDANKPNPWTFEYKVGSSYPNAPKTLREIYESGHEVEQYLAISALKKNNWSFNKGKIEETIKEESKKVSGRYVKSGLMRAKHNGKLILTSQKSFGEVIDACLRLLNKSAKIQEPAKKFLQYTFEAYFYGLMEDSLLLSDTAGRDKMNGSDILLSFAIRDGLIKSGEHVHTEGEYPGANKITTSLGLLKEAKVTHRTNKDTMDSPLDKTLDINFDAFACMAGSVYTVRRPDKVEGLDKTQQEEKRKKFLNDLKRYIDNKIKAYHSNIPNGKTWRLDAFDEPYLGGAFGASMVISVFFIWTILEKSLINFQHRHGRSKAKEPLTAINDVDILYGLHYFMLERCANSRLAISDNRFRLTIKQAEAALRSFHLKSSGLPEKGFQPTTESRRNEVYDSYLIETDGRSKVKAPAKHYKGEYIKSNSKTVKIQAKKTPVATTKKKVTGGIKKPRGKKKVAEPGVKKPKVVKTVSKKRGVKKPEPSKKRKSPPKGKIAKPPKKVQKTVKDPDWYKDKKKMRVGE